MVSNIHGLYFGWLDLVRVSLDRLFVSIYWEDKYPLCLAWSLTRVGSDHAPVILDKGESKVNRNSYFFENQWLLNPGFVEMVQEKNGWKIKEGDLFKDIFWTFGMMALVSLNNSYRTGMRKS